jgi:hypothetical protein
MKVHDSKLAAKVAAVNAVHAEINRIAPVYAEQFAPCVGKQIDKAGGGLLDRVVKALRLPELNMGNGYMLYRYQSNYSLVYVVKGCECYQTSGGQVAEYYEESFYVGELSNGVLVRVMPVEPRKADYSEAEIRALAESVRSAEKALSEAKSKLQPFECGDVR